MKLEEVVNPIWELDRPVAIETWALRAGRWGTYTFHDLMQHEYVFPIKQETQKQGSKDHE